MKTTIEKAVDTAFTAFADLVEEATLTKRSVTGFDFTTGTTTETSDSATIKVLKYETVSDGDDSPLYRYIVKSKDFPFSNYNTLVIGSRRYRVEKATYYEGAVQLDLRGEESV